MDSNKDHLKTTSLLKTTILRLIGASFTCTVAVTLALGALDVLTENSLSRAAGIANAKTVLGEWLPSRVPESEVRQVALVSPTEVIPYPVPDPVVSDEPVVMPVVQPETEPVPAPRPAPPPMPPVAAKPEPSPQTQRTALAAVARRALVVSTESDETSNAPVAKSDGAVETAAIPLPTPAPKRPPPPPTPAQRLKLDAKALAKAEKCLAEAIYFEARSETMRGQLAVAQVVMNRVFSPFYPNDVCGVVYQNAHRRLSCQFTFACDGMPERVTEWTHWRRAKHIAKQTLDGKVWVREVAKSTHYHAVYVRPVWVREMKKMVRYGAHTFYRPHRWGDGSKETSWSNISRIASRAAIVE